MTRLRMLPATAVLGIVISTPAFAQPSASATDAGPNVTLMEGDRWAEVFIETDKKGDPVTCSLGKTNIKYKFRYKVCGTLLSQLQFKPGSSTGKPGKGLHKIMYIDAGAERIRLENLESDPKQN